MDRRTATPPRRQRGQSAVFVLGLAAALAAALLVSHATAQRLADKRRAIDAADAAAFGGAVWQARVLNFHAYANRAIVANEVALAQAVSLRSWSAHVGRTLANADAFTRYVPYLGEAVGLLRRGWRGVDAAVQPSMQAVEIASAAVETALAETQPLVEALGAAAAGDVARGTLDAYGIAPSVAGDALFARNAAEWASFTREYAGASRARLRDLVHEGRDGFTRDRGGRFDPVPVGLLVRLEKRGGTELVGFETWRAVDTLALHRRQGFLFGRFRESVPLGWGAAQNARWPTPARGEHGGAWRTNARTARLAEQTLRTATGRAYSGLPAVRDVADPQRREDLELRFVVAARTAASDPLQRDAGIRADRIGAPQADVVVAANVESHAIAAAAVRFDRPGARRDGRREYPSLFGPYWSARLVAPSAGERTFAAGVRGVVDPFAGVAP